MIQENRSPKLFERVTQHRFDIWLGLSFERFCVKHAAHLASIMGFQEEMLLAAPYFERNDKRFQIDLLYQRADKVITLCEIKYHHATINTKIIPAVERKRALLPLPRGYSCEKALISLRGPDSALRDSGYFDHYVGLEDILDQL
ncbi:MAG: hypothetical protein GKR87_15915 [Kiritimatiellae bacterium]|nr:hypothetical protein [Kiritimatiellia bacterium]